jgi:Uma2 family endonuclease
MLQALPKQITFDEFMAWYPENSEYRYELHDGEIIQMPKPIGKHSKVGGYLTLKVGMEIERLQLPYFIPKECVVKVEDSGYEPDVIVLNERSLGDDPRWEKESTITLGQSAKLVIEIVSTNWSDDYALKLEDYETLGIEEYWICDYLGLGGKRYIGLPKQPTFSVYHLNQVGEYQSCQFRGDDLIVSSVFPELQLSLNQILSALNR